MFIISALGASPPGTMGGNTKIAVEMARYLAAERETHVFLPRYKEPTFTNNLPSDHRVILHTLDDFPGNDKFRPIAYTHWFTHRVRALFSELGVGPDDFVFSCSDFHCDVLPIYPLQKEFGFRWIPSLFLFVPFIFENLRQGYRFPPLKYLIYWFYQHSLFWLMKRRATAFVVTNESDFGKFPQKFRDGRLFAYYGGVNIEQIVSSKSSSKSPCDQSKTFQVTFCSRLHQQKGIDSFLDIWKLVVDGMRTKGEYRPLRLAIIGNGAPDYEHYLRNKAEKLRIGDTIDWLGYVNNEAKYRIYDASDLFVHPTVFDNNGMVAAEALCTGLPVVMYDLPALRHVYATGCVKIPFGDKTAFATEIVHLMTDSAHYAAVAPTPDQIAALRAHWNWASRTTDFKTWLETLPKVL